MAKLKLVLVLLVVGTLCTHAKAQQASGDKSDNQFIVLEREVVKTARDTAAVGQLINVIRENVETGKIPSEEMLSWVIGLVGINERRISKITKRRILDFAIDYFPARVETRSLMPIYLEKYNYLLEFKNMDSMRFYLKKIERIGRMYPDSERELVVLKCRADLAIAENRYLESLELYTQWRNTKPKGIQEDSLEMAWAELNTGRVYLELRHSLRSVIHYKAAGSLFAALQDTTNLAVVYNNLGILYKRLDSLDLAEQYIVRGIQLNSRIGEELGLAPLMLNLANIKRRQGKYTEALYYVDSSMAICQQHGLDYGIMLCNICKAEIFLGLDRLTEAQRLLTLAEKSLQDFNSSEVEREWLEVAASVFNKLGDTRKAYAYLKRHSELLKNADNKQQERLIAEWEDKLKREEESQKIAEVQDRLQQQQYRNRILLLLGLMLVLVLAGGVKWVRDLRSREAILARLVEEEKENSRLKLSMKDKELASQSLHLQTLLNYAENVTTELRKYEKTIQKPDEELRLLIQNMEDSIPREMWENFMLHFEKLENEFSAKLLAICPDLTPNEVKIASLLRLKLTTKEIAQLTNRAAGTVDNKRSAIRNKLNLSEDDNLVAFLMSL
jgi:tetratricopeptide (TPR) repeat protein